MYLSKAARALASASGEDTWTQIESRRPRRTIAGLDPRPAEASRAVHQRKRFRRKRLLSMRFDPDVLEWFRKGPRYQTRMNAVLRAYVEHARGDRG